MVNKWGYAIEKRVPNDFIMFKRSYISDKNAGPDDGVKRTIRASVNDNVVTPDFKPVRHPDLSNHKKKELERRCDNIVHHFPDPFSVPESVRARLNIAMQKMTVPEAQFVLEYMDENFPITDKGE